MPNSDDEQNQTVQGTVLPDDDHLRNRMRLQEALREELATDVKWLMQSEQDLLKIFRFYLVVLGAYISVGSLLVDQTEVPVLFAPDEEVALFNMYTASAVLFWTVAVVGAIVAYTVIWSSVGVNDLHHVKKRLQQSNTFEDTADAFDTLNLEATLDQPAKDFEDEIIYNYIQSIHHTEREFGYVRYPFLWGGMALVTISVLSFGMGLLVAGVGSSSWSKLSIPWAIVIKISGNIVLVIGYLWSFYMVMQILGNLSRFGAKIRNSAARDLGQEEGNKERIKGVIRGSWNFPPNQK